MTKSLMRLLGIVLLGVAIAAGSIVHRAQSAQNAPVYQVADPGSTGTTGG